MDESNHEDTKKEFKQEAASSSEKQAEKPGKLSYFFELFKIVLWALIIIIPIRTFLFQPFFVQGASMEPNFHDGEYLIVNELGYKETSISLGEKEFFEVTSFKDFLREDVVVFRYPKNPKEYFIKRIIGLPGEKVKIENGEVEVFNEEYSGGFSLDESDYLPSVEKFTDCTGNNCVFELKMDEYMVLGDNRSHSSDSRSWGVLKQEFIIGKVLLRAWPLSEFNFFN